MIHFNELYITEDGKNLVIDVGIDDISVYDKCYIDSINITTAAKLCGDDKTGCEFTPVYTSGTGITYVDMDGDGVITECDINIVDRINELIDKMLSDDADNKYDLNKDGVVDLADLALLAKTIVNTSEYDSNFDLNENEEMNIEDINEWVTYVSTRQDRLTDEEKEFFLDKEDDDGNRIIGAFNTYVDLINNPTALKRKSTAPQRHVRLCLSSIDVYLKPNQSLSNDLFIVKVKAHVAGNKAKIVEMGCGWDLSELTGAAYNPYPLYRNFMNMANEYGDKCDSNMDNLVDFIL